MATLSVERITYTGLAAAYSAAAGGGDKVPSGDRNFLHFKNGDASPTTVTISTPGTVDGIAIDDPQVIVAATGEAFFGPLPRGTFGDSADSNLVSISYSSVTSLTVAAVQL